MLLFGTLFLSSSKNGLDFSMAAKLGIPMGIIQKMWVVIPISFLGCIVAFKFQGVFTIKGLIVFFPADQTIKIDQENLQQLISYENIETLTSKVSSSKGEFDPNSVLISSGTKNYMSIKLENGDYLSFELYIPSKSDILLLQQIISSIKKTNWLI